MSDSVYTYINPLTDFGLKYIFGRHADKEADECENTLERWIFLMKNMEKMEAMPMSFMKDPVFRKLGQVAKFAALNDKD